LGIKSRKEEETAEQCTMDTAWFVLVTKCSDDEIKGDEMGGAYGTCGGEKCVHSCGGES
jgi:hypothetical protein